MARETTFTCDVCSGIMNKPVIETYFGAEDLRIHCRLMHAQAGPDKDLCGECFYQILLKGMGR